MSNWYFEINDYVSNLSDVYKVDKMKIAGILSALSPNNTFRTNILSLEKFLRTKGNCKVSCFNTQKEKAIKIYNLKDYNEDTIKEILRGLKTTAFFMNIHRPENKEYVTIDLWINRVFKNDGKSITPKKYRDYSNAIKLRAEKIGVIPSSYQAHIWEKIRGNKY